METLSPGLLSDVVSSIGLALDMAGVVMLAKYGLVSNPLTTQGYLLRFEGDDLGLEPLPDEANLARSYVRRARLGWSLVFAGLLGQLVGVWIPS